VSFPIPKPLRSIVLGLMEYYRVLQALYRCGREVGGQQHQNGASCGEITTALGYVKDTQNKGQGLNGAKVVTVRSTTPRDGPVYPADPNSIEVFDPCGWDSDPEHPDNKGRADVCVKPMLKCSVDLFQFVPNAFGCYQTTKQIGIDPYMVNQFRDYKIGPKKGAQKKDAPELFDIGYPQLLC
jgi:hypothetical protein